MYDERSGTPKRAGARKPEEADGGAAARAAEALRRAGGALAVEQLGAEVPPDPAGRAEPLARCLRRRDDLFLLVERPIVPWDDAGDGWTAADRAEYERARRRDPTVVLLDGSTGTASVRAPAVLRESLLTIWGESPEDAEVRRELGRLAG